MSEKIEKIVLDYNMKTKNAREQYKIAMYFYYLTKLHAIKQLHGMVASELQNWFDFCNPNKKLIDTRNVFTEKEVQTILNEVCIECEVEKCCLYSDAEEIWYNCCFHSFFGDLELEYLCDHCKDRLVCFECGDKCEYFVHQINDGYEIEELNCCRDGDDIGFSKYCSTCKQNYVDRMCD